MLRSRHILRAIAAASAVALLAFLWWYGGNEEPLRSEEVDRFIQRIESQTQTPDGRHDLPSLRRFLENDDGRPFYTVNLYKFRDRAEYQAGSPFQGTGMQAFERFSEVMLRLLARHSSHPIFGSDWVDASTDEWDRIVIVRYRSRRDIADIFASTEFAEASAHKWAGLERNGRMLVQGLHIPELVLPASLTALAFVAGLLALAARVGPSGAAPQTGTLGGQCDARSAIGSVS